MIEQGVKYVVTLSDMGVTTGLKNLERNAVSAEASIGSLNASLRSMGVMFGAMELINFGKNAVQGAAYYEVSMLRIKNASDNATDGLKNQLFINKEVDTFKLKLQETVDAYGAFLFKIKNAKLNTTQKNDIFSELLMVGKVGGLSQ